MEELLAEYEMLAHELEEFLPTDTILTFEEEETEVETFAEDEFDNSGDTISIDQDTMALEVKVEVQEIEEENVETYELLDTEPEIQEEEVELIDQHEENMTIENDIWEEVEEDPTILEEEIELSNINQAIEELTSEIEITELELVQLEKELETIIDEKQVIEQVEEPEIEAIEDNIQEEESQIEENDTDLGYEALEEQDLCNQDTMDSDTTDSTSLEAMEHEETIFDQELEENPLITLEYPFDEEFEEPEEDIQGITCDQEFEEVSGNELENQIEADYNEELEELEKIIVREENQETSEINEIINDIQPEDVKQNITLLEEHTQRETINIEMPSIQSLNDFPTIQSIETHLDNIPLQSSFGLSFTDQNFHHFSLNLLDT